MKIAWSLWFFILFTQVWCEIPPFKTYWFQQDIDHFNFRNQEQYAERYLVADRYFKAGGPLFFYTGNEGDIEEFYSNSGFVFELAERFGALVVFAEHRYYGQSLPYGKDSWKLHNIGYLSIEQALADYAILIPYIKGRWSIPNVPVITFGGSYGGMLAGYIRIRYPYIVDAALAASAPIPATQTHSLTPGYFEVTTNDLAKGDPICPNLVRQGFSQLLQLASQGKPGLDTISKTFSLCKSLADQNDVEHLILWAVNAFGSMAMMDYPYPTNFLAPLPAYPMNYACNLLKQRQNNLLAGLAAAVGLFYNGTAGTLACFDIFKEFIFCADQTGCGEGPDGDSWDYQACTEVVYFPNTNNVTDMFPPRNWTLANLNDYCLNKWNVIPRPDWLTTQYGGLDISQASRIIFSNGLLDPWHGGGFLNNMSNSLIAFIIKDGAHHLDLRSSNPSDPPSVVSARAEEMNMIDNWLLQAKAERKKREETLHFLHSNFS